jgi:hypothetical protein
LVFIYFILMVVVVVVVVSFPFLAANHLLLDVFRHFGFSRLAFLLFDFFLVILLGRSAMWLLEWGLKLSEEERAGGKAMTGGFPEDVWCGLLR